MKTNAREIKKVINNAEFVLLSQTVIKDMVIELLMDFYSNIRDMEPRSYKKWLDQQPLEQLLTFLKRATQVAAKDQTTEGIC